MNESSIMNVLNINYFSLTTYPLNFPKIHEQVLLNVSYFQIFTFSFTVIFRYFDF